MEFYVRLKELRKEAGETQKMLASAIGISVNQVIRVEIARLRRVVLNCPPFPFPGKILQWIRGMTP